MSRYALSLGFLYTFVDLFLIRSFSFPAIVAGWLALWSGSRLVWQLFLLARLGMWLFFAYFGRLPGVVDLKLFTLHLSETFEALGGMLSFFLLPLASWLLLALLGLRLEERVRRPLVSAAGVAVLLWSALAPATPGAAVTAPSTDTPPQPARRSDISVVLVVGESLGYDSAIARRFAALGLPARPIFPAATATDTSLALFFNGASRLPVVLRESTNLFALAKAGGYGTRFCSAQPVRWLRHLRPLLAEECIGDERLGLGDDMALLDCLDLSAERPAFIVLHQIGEHAPYTYYPPPHADDPAIDYRRSLDRTFTFYKEVVAWAKAQKRPLVVLGTADHGELTGQEGRWGHNTFDPVVMRVPFWYFSNLPQKLPSVDSVLCHRRLYTLAVSLMGYDASLPACGSVWGTMLTGEDGSFIVGDDRGTPGPAYP